jgi:hypothetical protein
MEYETNCCMLLALKRKLSLENGKSTAMKGTNIFREWEKPRN